MIEEKESNKNIDKLFYKINMPRRQKVKYKVEIESTYNITHNLRQNLQKVLRRCYNNERKKKKLCYADQFFFTI